MRHVKSVCSAIGLAIFALEFAGTPAFAGIPRSPIPLHAGTLSPVGDEPNAAGSWGVAAYYAGHQSSPPLNPPYYVVAQVACSRLAAGAAYQVAFVRSNGSLAAHASFVADKTGNGTAGVMLGGYYPGQLYTLPFHAVDVYRVNGKTKVLVLEWTQ